MVRAIGTVPTNPVLGQHAVGERAFGRARRSPARFGAEEYAAQHAANIRIDHRNALTECKAQHGGGGVVADTGQSDELVVGARQLIAIFFRHHAGTFLQSQRTARIAKPAPCGDHIGFRCCGKSTGVRPARHPIVPIRHHTTHLRLLAHHLTDQHAPRRGPSEAPWQVTRIGLPPCAEP